MYAFFLWTSYIVAMNVLSERAVVKCRWALAKGEIIN